MSNGYAPAEGLKLPPSIARTLRLTMQRVRLVVFLRGVAAVVAVGVLSLLAVMAVDATVVIFSSTTRWFMTAGAWLVTALAAIWFLARPLSRTMTLSGVARILEKRHPEMQERISSAVELLQSRDSASVRGSDVLIAALVEQATDSIATVQPRREITFRAARRFLVAAGCVLGVLAFLVAVWPRGTARLLARAVNPAANLPNVHADQISWTVLAAMENARPHDGGWAVLNDASLPLRIEVKRRGVDEVRVLMTGPSGIETAYHAEASLREDRVFLYNIAPRESSYRVRLHAGDAVTAYTNITVTPRPTMRSIDVSYDYPDYTEMETTTVVDAEGPIAAVTGTEVKVVAHTNCRVALAKLYTSDHAEAIATGTVTSSEDGDTCSFTFPLGPDLGTQWRMELSDQFGFTNDPTLQQLAVLPDLSPVVAITYPPTEADLALPPRDTLPIGYVAQDDFGIAAMRVEFKTAGTELAPLEVDLRERNPEMRGVIPLELGKLRLGNALSLSFRLTVEDAHPGESGGQLGHSDWRTIRIERSADSIAAQALRERIESLQKRLQAILAQLQEVKETTLTLDRTVGIDGALAEEIIDRLDGIATSLDNAGNATSELALELKGGTFGSFTGRLTYIAETQIGGALGSTYAIKLNDRAANRTEAAQEADFRVAQAIVGIEELLEDLKKAAEAASREQQVAELADEQERLANEREAMERNQENPDAAAPQMTEEEMNQRQDEMAEAVQKMLEDMMRDTAESALARELSADAKELAQEQQEAANESRELAEREQARNELSEIIEQQRELAKRARELNGADTSADNMEKAAEDLDEGKNTDALQKQEWAARSLGDLQQRLAKQPQDQAVADKLTALAKQQDEFAKKVEAAAKKAQEAREQNDKRAEQNAQQELRNLAREENAIRQEAEKISKDARQASPDAQKAASREARDLLDGARSSMERNRPEQAAEGARAAADRLAEDAKQLQEKTPTPEEGAKRSAEAKKLETEQWELRNRTRRALEKAQVTTREMEKRQQNDLLEDQWELAREALELADEVRREQPTENNTERDAAREATQAAREMERGELAEAADTAREAAEDMQELAEQLNGDLAERAEELGRRQESIARRAEQQVAGQQREAAETRQQELSRRTEQLAQEASELAESITNNEDASDWAERANQQIAQAQTAQGQASKELEAGEPQAAQEQQQQAADRLAEASQFLAGTASRMARATAQTQDAQQQQPEMSQAAESTAEAARTDATAEARQAARDLRSAQQAMAQQAQQLGAQPFSPENMAQRSTQMAEPKEGRLRPEGEGTELRAVGLREAEWGRLRELDAEAMQGGRRDAPPEYRALIREYYKRLADMQKQRNGGSR